MGIRKPLSEEGGLVIVFINNLYYAHLANFKTIQLLLLEVLFHHTLVIHIASI